MTIALTGDIHPRLTATALPALVRPHLPLWTPGSLRDLTARLTHDLRAELLDIVRFSSPQRWWTRLAATDDVEVWLLSWLPGQETLPHDHGGASGSFTVLLGELSETYRYPAGPIRNHLHPARTSIGFGAGRAHQVRNLGPAMAASVHAYSPPQVPTREYRSLRDIPDEIPALPTQRGAR